MTIKTVQEHVKNWSWVLVPIIAIGGLFWPRLGLLLLPIMITLIGIGLFRGKYWCGNLCPHGSLFDRIIGHFSPGKKLPQVIKNPWLKWGFFVFFMGMFSIRVIGVLGHWGNIDFWDRLGFVMVLNYMIPTIIGVTLGLIIKPRAWCKFCPMGTVAELSYRLGKKIGFTEKTDLLVSGTSPDLCKNCELCNRSCPLELNPQKAINVETLDDPRCIKCSLCTENCPKNLLTMKKAS